MLTSPLGDLYDMLWLVLKKAAVGNATQEARFKKLTSGNR